MRSIPRALSFHKKLLTVFFLCSIVPLVIVAFFVSARVQLTYTSTLLSTFESKASDHERLVNSFVESNKLWVRTLASQDLLLTEVETIASQSAASANTHSLLSSQKLFASLTSITAENPFIDRLYIIDNAGKILISTSTNDIGNVVGNPSFLSVLPRSGQSSVGAIYVASNGKRRIPFAAPLIRKRDQRLVGVLVVELHGAVIQSLLSDSGEGGGKQDSYLLDQEGRLLTKIAGIDDTQPIFTEPYESCRKGIPSPRGEWIGTMGEKVFGVSRCIRVDDMMWTLSIERPTREAYAVGNQLSLIILGVAAGVSLFVFFLIYWLSKSLTRPIALLSQGAKKFGQRDFKHRIELATGDELETLANSFNEMANQIEGHIADLQNERDRLEMQKKRLDISASLLLRRDLDLRSTYELLELEKERIAFERNKLEIILGGVRDAVIAVDPSRKIISLNKAAEVLLGAPLAQLTGKPLDAIVRFTHQDEVLAPQVYCPDQVKGHEGVVFSREGVRMDVMRVQAQSGSPDGVAEANESKSINLTVGQIREATEFDLGAILTMHDVTDERQLEEMKLDFVSMAAHELRTPLTAIIGYIELLRLDGVEKLSEQQHVFLDRLSVSSQILRTLIDNLLNVSRIEQGTFKIEVVPTDMVNLIVEQVKNFENQIRAKHQTMVFVPPQQKPGSVMADPVRINQVLANLIANAIAYTPEGGTISIELKEQDGMVQTMVRDTGIGIPKDALSKLFTKFFRVTGVLEQGSKGNGLGLYITKSIVLMHKGTIGVESELGRGSTFIFTLPVASAGDLAHFRNGAKYASLRPSGMNGIIVKA